MLTVGFVLCPQVSFSPKARVCKYMNIVRRLEREGSSSLQIEKNIRREGGDCVALWRIDLHYVYIVMKCTAPMSSGCHWNCCIDIEIHFCVIMAWIRFSTGIENESRLNLCQSRFLSKWKSVRVNIYMDACYRYRSATCDDIQEFVTLCSLYVRLHLNIYI